MTRQSESAPKSSPLDAETRALVRISAAIAAGSEGDVRRELVAAHGVASILAIDEVILQAYLFAGFPRTLNAARAWRAIEPAAAAGSRESGLSTAEVRQRGEETCRVVYGGSYDKLRENIRGLHPELDEWMIVDGYGKVLGRPGLALAIRELAIVAACAASGQQRQLHSHLHGALNSGASPEAVIGTLGAIADMMSSENSLNSSQLFSKILNSRSSSATPDFPSSTTS